jgi:hypothetical protein
MVVHSGTIAWWHSSGIVVYSGLVQMLLGLYRYPIAGHTTFREKKKEKEG